MKTCRGILVPGGLALALTLGVGPDSTLTQISGYGGVLPLPLMSEATSSTMPRLEILSPRGSDARAERGRVLYANDRSSRNTEAPRAPRDKRPCTTSLATGRTSATPNS